MILAMGAAAAALAVALTVALFRVLGAKRTRLVAQIVAAVIGAAFVIGLQVAAILSYGTLSRRRRAAVARRCWRMCPDIGSVVWWPARAALGDGMPLAAVLAVSFVAARRRDRAHRAALRRIRHHRGRRRQHQRGRARGGHGFRANSPQRALRRKEWMLLRARSLAGVADPDADALSRCRRRVLLWRSFEPAAAPATLLVPVLVMAAGQLAGGLAWLTISGEDAPDLVATAPVPPRFVLRAKIEAVLGVIALVFAPLVVVLAFVSPWHALVTAAGIVVAAGAATSIQLWFRTQAKRSQFRRRQMSSRVATFAEAFSSIGWAATAAVAAISLWLAIPPAAIALAILGGARYLSPRAQGLIRHCERSEAIQAALPHKDSAILFRYYELRKSSSVPPTLDCFVAALLAIGTS